MKQEQNRLLVVVGLVWDCAAAPALLDVRQDVDLDVDLLAEHRVRVAAGLRAQAHAEDRVRNLAEKTAQHLAVRPVLLTVDHRAVLDAALDVQVAPDAQVHASPHVLLLVGRVAPANADQVVQHHAVLPAKEDVLGHVRMDAKDAPEPVPQVVQHHAVLPAKEDVQAVRDVKAHVAQHVLIAVRHHAQVDAMRGARVLVAREAVMELVVLNVGLVVIVLDAPDVTLLAAATVVPIATETVRQRVVLHVMVIAKEDARHVPEAVLKHVLEVVYIAVQ